MHARIVQQGIGQGRYTTAAEVVSWLGAVQAQDYPGAKWSLGMRMEGATDARIEQAVNAGEILRTHVLRPTWHFVTPTDIRWLLALTGPRVAAANNFRLRQLELDETQLARSRAVIAQALQGGASLTRAELGEQVASAGISTAGQRLPYMLMMAELEGLVCSGPRRGSQFTYALLEERVAPAPSLEREEALAEITRRYFTGHAPASLKDFTWWSGLTVADAKTGLALLGSQVEELQQEGQTHYCCGPLPSGAHDIEAVLLPTYDELLVGYSDFGRARAGSSDPAKRRRFDPRLLVGGQVAGSWQRILKKSRVLIQVESFRLLTGAEEEQVHAAASRYGKFVELPAEVEFL
jgi:hypothetical protein